MNEETEIEITKRLDIRGKVCPLTYVYTKLNLESMSTGEILEVTLDFPAAVKSIPKSAMEQKLGEIIKVEEISGLKNTWILLIRRI